MEITVTSCEKAKEVSGKPVYKVGLSDGRFGESFAKEIPVGTNAADIEINDTQWGLKFKLNSKGGFGGGKAAQKPNNAAFALSYSKDWAIAQLSQNKPVTTKDILTIADQFYGWIESKQK